MDNTSILPYHVNWGRYLSIKTLPIFDLIGQHVERSEMFRAFNMGVGMVLVVREADAEAVLANTDGYVIGALEAGSREAVLV